ncbi:hypothetical protein PTNB73_00048 [Pyrenophora teres f. teres]|uniref:Ankyrin repeat-containing protein n=1 Tax=Pyrenophora teres f. teres TaxID=97479 RepID=A0A6S6VS42_9PLEO|nr:hypothetical protein HRS9139_01292 [Pyrenophora teres f. teres]KAE8850938.1 hypothetical protein PTNB85_01354 [Pyrenophora teres f. teres]KAE8851030.1 hypothetical protein HRS9122_01317 [Pyrenophora teres f. teres]KAE8869703.1 hypothetical protein PTNB29_00047 [Pyrenophora teres f. teres]KAE8873416.1 hypothetical protein PTNB73_00048 [Pyrenophora teres f. teres]
MRRLVKAFRALAGEDDELKLAFNHFRKTIQREQGIVRNSILAGVQNLQLETRAVHRDIQETLVLTEEIDRKTDGIVIGTNGIHRYLETQETTLERNNILSWLSSLDFHKKQRDIHSRHCDGTGSWFLNAGKFQQWLNSTRSFALWCSGIPGAGKSVMTSIAVNHIAEHTARRDVAIAYVYCDYTDSKLQSEIELICSLTRQLVEQIHPISEEVKTYRDRWIEKRSYPTEEERVSLIKDIASKFTRTYVFVDALDECPEQNRNKLLHMLQMLEPYVHLFITSRPNLELHSTFPNLSHIEIAASHSDIQVYLESEISTNDRMSLFIAKDNTLKAEIIDTISRKAEGMFLVAHFQVAYICQVASPKKVRQRLNTLPTEVYDFYEKALARIEDYFEEDRQLVKMALAYIFCAKRPLTLEELQHALGIEAEDTEIDESALPEMDILFNISVGLIRVNEKSNVVALVHHTLQEYLAKHPSKLGHQPEAEVSKTCLTYLSMNVFDLGPCVEGKALEQRLQDYLSLDYASRFWGYHLVHKDLPEWRDLFLDFLSNEQKVASYLQVLHVPRHRGQGWFDCFPKQFTPLHVAAYWGLHWALKIHPVNDVDINSQDSRGTSALQLAAKNGHSDVLRLLLDKGANLDTRNNRSETALHWAVRSGNMSIAELLLLKGADVMVEDSEGWTALDWAVIGGYAELTRLLLDRCHHVDSGYSGTNKALILAAEAGTESTVQMLLDLGANVDWKDHVGSSALAWAIPEGHEKVVRVLLSNGANVNSRDVFGNTPLHWSLPFVAITRLLLDNGAEIDAKNDVGHTPLMWSAHDGQEIVLQLLLDNGADVTVKDRYGCTALHIAALRGHETVASVLLQNGSDPDTYDQDGWTALHAAALKRHDGFVRLLVDKTGNGESILKWVESQQENARMQALLAHMADRKSEGSSLVSGLGSAVQEGQFERVQAFLKAGVDIDAYDGCGFTALTLAICARQSRIMQLLLEHEALVNKPERNGRSAFYLAAEYGADELLPMLAEYGADINSCIHTWTPLLIAAQKGHEKTVEYLVKNGANVNAEDYYGRRALHWTAQHGHQTTLQLLTEHGADIHAKDQWSRTPLLCAVGCRQLAAAKFLLDIGADIEAQTRDASTSLHVASYLGDKTMVSLLLQRGASVEARTRKGFKPLHVAALFGREDIAQLLLEKDDDIDAATEESGFDNEDSNDAEGTIENFTDEDGFGVDDVFLGTALCVERYGYQRLVKEGKGVSMPRSWTAQELAVMSGNRAVQELLTSSGKAP